MCGIIGALDLTGNRDFPAEWLRAMTGAIAHRGPNDEYFHREPGLSLGKCRLAIVDLANGRQPLANEDKTVWVSFNGELFDYPVLRQQLLVPCQLLIDKFRGLLSTTGGSYQDCGTEPDYEQEVHRTIVGRGTCPVGIACRQRQGGRA